MTDQQILELSKPYIGADQGDGEILLFAHALLSASKPAAAQSAPYVDIVFSEPHDQAASHEFTFVEIEDERGHSIRFGKWLKRDDGYWVLRIAASPTAPAQPCCEDAADGAMGEPYYLIERRDSTPTVWWKGPRWADVTPDAAKATRYGSKHAAERQLYIFSDDSLFVSEHLDVQIAASDSEPVAAMERAFSSDAMGRRDELVLSDRHAETPLLLDLLSAPLIDSIALYDVRIKLENALANARAASPQLAQTERAMTEKSR